MICLEAIFFISTMSSLNGAASFFLSLSFRDIFD